MMRVRNARLQHGPIRWSLQSQSKGVEIYLGDDPKASVGVSTWCGVTEIPGTIEEIATMFMSNTTDEYRNYCRLFAKDYMDAVNLYNIASPTPSQPLRSINVKWIAQQSPIPAIVKHRDWCFLESCYEFDVDGTRGWVQAYKSTKMLQCPDLQSTFGVVRAEHHLSGFVFFQSNDRPGYIRVVSTWQVNVKGKVPRWIFSRSIKMRCFALRDLHASIQETRLRHVMSESLLPIHRLIPFELRSRCFICQIKFGMVFTPKYNCRGCGEVVCRKCCQRWNRTTMNVCVCVVCTMGSLKRGDVEGPPIVQNPRVLLLGTTNPLDESLGGDMGRHMVPVLEDDYDSDEKDVVVLADGRDRGYGNSSPRFSRRRP
ncbi:hypothetical protein B5M09_013121 [Aphanomyces astaci]|uniref:FYVE-type domain-containing protein n=1 Tax=Aphanomyces astaci TaxID=112090 RepID=A0A3R7W0L7_APHAT|nr:hypothetical protein B5M09_013121 [Aphanomyces astaci]